MCRSALLFTLLALMLATGLVSAQGAAGRSNGVGIILGEPTGFSYKHHIDRTNALALGAAWSFSGSTHFHLQGDYLWHRYDLIQVKSGQLPVYFGLGGRVEFREDKDDLWGLRIPFGLDYYFAGVPLDIFVELVPVLQLLPDSGVDLEGALGLRFWF